MRHARTASLSAATHAVPHEESHSETVSDAHKGGTTKAEAREEKSLHHWLTSHLPEGGHILEGTRVVHTTEKGDTYLSVAKKYLDLTDIYQPDDLAREIAKANGSKGHALEAPIKEGQKIEIPSIIDEVPRLGDDARIGWPEDRVLRGLYIRGATAGGHRYMPILEKMAERDYNAIVLDIRDYDGPITFPTKVSLATETKAQKGAPIRDLSRTIRFAHEKNIRVIARIACFEDEAMARAKTALSVKSKRGGVYHIGWLDPSNEDAQNYVIDLAKEAMAAGADEVELDYVRYPVLGIKGADFHLEERNLTKIQVIRDFVRRVHTVTAEHKVPLSLDIFGVVAHGQRSDIEALGQDPPVIGAEVEALSPMVYPSHYSKGFMGFEEPGDHPEIVGFGTRKTIEQLGENKKQTIIRPWIQAVAWKSPSYGPDYLRREMKSAEENGSKGWLLWQPSQDYSLAWAVRPSRKR